MMRASLFIIVLVATGCTCGSESRDRGPLHRGELPAPPSSHDEHESAPRPEGSAEPRPEGSAGGLAWHAEEPLVSRAPISSMRAAEYGVRDFADAELSVFYFGRDQGGGVDENITRWVDQFQQPDGSSSRGTAQIERTEVAGMPVTTVEAAGAFVGMRGMGAPSGPRPGFRLLGAIVQGPEGMVFFKLTGPATAVDAAEGAFRTLIQSIHPE